MLRVGPPWTKQPQHQAHHAESSNCHAAVSLCNNRDLFVSLALASEYCQPDVSSGVAVALCHFRLKHIQEIHDAAKPKYVLF